MPSQVVDRVGACAVLAVLYRTYAVPRRRPRDSRSTYPSGLPPRPKALDSWGSAPQRRSRHAARGFRRALELEMIAVSTSANLPGEA